MGRADVYSECIQHILLRICKALGAKHHVSFSPTLPQICFPTDHNPTNPPPPTDSDPTNPLPRTDPDPTNPLPSDSDPTNTLPPTDPNPTNPLPPSYWLWSYQHTASYWSGSYQPSASYWLWSYQPSISYWSWLCWYWLILLILLLLLILYLLTLLIPALIILTHHLPQPMHPLRSLISKNTSLTGLHIMVAGWACQRSRYLTWKISLPYLPIQLTHSGTHESAVHLNSSLQDVDKFNYLKFLLERSAYNAIVWLTLSSTSYRETTDMLKSRLGNRQMSIKTYGHPGEFGCRNWRLWYSWAASVV